MKFKKIEFKDKSVQRVYDNYLKSVETAVRPLTQQDRMDILMEINSHLYENLQNAGDQPEMNSLLDAIDRLGVPEEVLRPLIAEKLLDKATRTFNPLHIITALFYNIANGISYIIFAVLYLFLFCFVFLIGAKLFNPEVGMYFYEGKFQALGISRGQGHTEVLGNWFIPVMIILSIVWYLFITLLLKLKKSLLKGQGAKSIISVVILAVIAQVSFEQNSSHEKLDSFMNVLDENDRFFGSVAISKNDEILYSKAIGYADLDKKIRNNMDTKFRIGSISKTFTAVLVMKGVELGKIDLDETIGRYFPQIQNARKITIRQLLNHRSGIKNVTDRKYLSWYTNPIAPQDMVDSIAVRGVNFEPNARHSYSNSNYILLTFILEDAFDDNFPNLLERYIVEPLGLANTAYGSKINTSHNEALSYKMNDHWDLEPETDPSVPLGAGGIISTPIDLCKFMEALYNGKLLSQASVDQMQPLKGEEYGFALYPMTFDNVHGMGHGGAIDAFSSTTAYIEDENMAVAVICNGTNFGKHDVINAAIKEILNLPYDIPSFESVRLSEEELDRYVGTYETEKLSLDIDIFRKENDLWLQATGQGEAKLFSEGDHKFSFSKLGVKIEFDTIGKIMHFEQQGVKFDFTLKTDQEEKPLETEGLILSEKELNRYVGIYKTDELPLDIEISHNGKALLLQATGQPQATLKAEGNDKFTFDQLGVVIDFDYENDIMNFEQQGMKFIFKRDAR